MRSVTAEGWAAQDRLPQLSNSAETARSAPRRSLPRAFLVSRRALGRVLARASAAGAVCSAAAAFGVEVVAPAVGEATVSESGRAAAQWGLSEADWTRYGELMRGRRGLWTPDADPLLVLGAHARTAAERRRLAEAFVLVEHARVEGELAFERAVQEAWARLFPGQPRLALPPVAPPADRIAVVVDRDCADCGRLVRRHVRGAAPVDVYVRGAADDADLRAWVTEQEVPVDGIVDGQVTVNHLDTDRGAVPAVWGRREDGQWRALE